MDRLGRYQILDPIGSGPCGAVVRAKVYGVVGVDRQFALKQILPALTAHPPYAQALSAAARAYGSLEHPRIARLAEFTVSQGKTFTATELVTGLDVGRLVAESRISATALPAGGALTLLSAAARAVGYAHGRGLVHLGLCPQNLLISADGDVKVTDFGILAACLPEKPVQDPRLAHRVAYLAPEQLVGEPTSSATDVFALGAIAIEMVTGSPAFRGETPLDVQHAVLSGQLSDPSLPRPLVKVLQRCLARAPFERFPDARALADALDAALRVAPVPGTRQEISERVKAIMAHLAALNEGGLSGVVSLPSSMPAPTRPPTVLSPDEVIATPTSLPEHDRVETAEFLRDDAYQEEREDTAEVGGDEEIDEEDLVPHTVVQAMSEASSRSQRMNDAPMIAATLRGISAVSPPRPMPPPQVMPPVLGPAGAAPPPIPKGRAPTGRALKLPPADPAAPVAPQVAASDDGGPEVTTARHRAAEKNAWDEAMESFEQPTRLNESLTASLLPSTSRTGPAPIVQLDEIVLASLSDPLPRPVGPDEPSRAAGEVLLERSAASASANGATQDVSGSHDVEGATGAAEANGAGAEQEDPQDPTGGQRSSTARVAVAPATGPSSSMIRAIGRSPGVPAPPWPDPSSESGRVLAKVEETDDEPLPLMSASSPGEGGAMGFGLPPLRPSERAMPRPPERISYRSIGRPEPRTEPPIAGESDAYGNGNGAAGAGAGDDPFGRSRSPRPSEPIRPGLSPLEMSPYAPDTSPVPKLTGSGARWIWMLLGVAIVVGSAAAAYAVFGGFSERGTLAQPASSDGGVALASSTNLAGAQDAGASAGSGGASPAAAVDAQAAPADAKAATPSGPTNPTVTPAAPTAPTAPGDPADGLTITSEPAGARVYIDGADQGQTPLRLPGPPDRHSAVLFLAGYELATLEVEKAGRYTAELKEVTPMGGPAGIKVRCKVKDRYYVFVDGKPTGALCPTERLEMERGEHVVEIYDLISETRRQFRIDVKETSRSMRVRVD
jgi:serine/threonine protein kinase